MLLGHTVKFTQVTLGLIPEILDAIDMVFTGGKELGVIDPQMAEARNIQGIVAGQRICRSPPTFAFAVPAKVTFIHFNLPGKRRGIRHRLLDQLP